MGKFAFQMRILLFIFALLLFSCHKEPMQNTCTSDGKGTFQIYNGMAVPLEVQVFPNNGGPWLTTNGTLFLQTLQSGQKWDLSVNVGEYRITAHGQEPGPFAHNEYNFSGIETADDCETVKINY